MIRSSIHLPVMPAETVSHLAPVANANYLDGTVGGGGHARLILERNRPHGRLLGIDADPTAISRARQSLASYGSRVELRQGNYASAPSIAAEAGFGPFDGALLDIGVSSDLLADPTRGFSFSNDGPLDMRFDPSHGHPACHYVNSLPQSELADLIHRYGDERNSRRIARTICRARQATPISTTGQLARMVAAVAGKPRLSIHPATRTFQALRILVNDELQNLTRFLQLSGAICRRGGRIVVISFHSAEDRLVKLAFREGQAAGRLEIQTPRPLRPTELEIAQNRRARSARLRCAVVC